MRICRVARSDVRRFLSGFGPVSDESWARLKQAQLLARPDAPGAAGPFPLIIGALRPLSTTVTNEYLASHGYVVAMVDGDETTQATTSCRGLDVDDRDMEFARSLQAIISTQQSEMNQRSLPRSELTAMAIPSGHSGSAT